MILKKQQIKDVFLLEAECHRDERGLFRRHYCEKELKDSSKKSVIRILIKII